ncbi:MAG: hypothetical protein ACFCAD_25170, partial [Pleurocapsa sp.]
KINSNNNYPHSIPVSSQKLDEQTLELLAQKPITQEQEIEVQAAFPNDVLNIQKPYWQRSLIHNQQKTDDDMDIGGIIFMLIFGSPFILAVIFGLSQNSSNRSSSRSSGGFGGGSGGGSGSGGGGSGGGCGGGGGGGG